MAEKNKAIVRTPVLKTAALNPPIKLPKQLTEGQVFVCWKSESDKDGKASKVPYNPTTGRKAKSNDPETWNDFAVCHKAYRLGKYSGVSRALTADDGFVCIDLDNCKDEKTGKFTAEAIGIISKFSSYVEVSPSGSGLHVWLRGSKPGNHCRKGIVEIYEAKKFMTLTGVALFADSTVHKEVNNQQKELDELYFKIWPKKEAETPAPETKAEPRHSLTDEEIITKAKVAKNGEKFSLLWDGHWEEVGYLSQSEGDQGLTNIIAFWCDEDEERIDRLFRKSGLYRSKWDEKRGAKSYGEITIETAVATVKEYYSEINPLKALYRNEDGDSELFRHLFKDQLRFDHAVGEWFRWEDHYWKIDDLDNVMRDIEAVIKIYEKEVKRVAKLLAEAVTAKDKDAIRKWKGILKDLRDRIRVLRTRTRKKNVLALARCGDPLGLTGNEWDTNPWLLPCVNGVIDLKTGKLRDGKLEDFIKTVAPTVWKDSEKAPRWEKFLKEIFNGNMKLVSYVQRLLGYSIVGEVTEHILPIFWGSGRNGKGTLLEALAHILGPLAAPVPGEMLLTQNWSRSSAAPSADIMALRGRRLAWASETEEGRRLNISKVKWLVGGDTLAGRPPFGRRMIEFQPSHTLFLLTNNRPTASADDYALWQRIALIPFTQAFVDSPVEKSEHKVDPELPEKLKLESSGILAWLVRGCLEWQRRGLKPPESVRMATQEYREEEDILTLFLDDCCKVKKGLIVKASALYKQYKWWAEGLGHTPWSNTTFGARMSKRFKKEKMMRGIFYQDVTLTEEI